MSDLSARSPSNSLQRADDDRFAGAGLAGDRGETRRQFPFQILDQREIFDPQQTEEHMELRVNG
mgnify:CR=1 FL=1